VPGLWLGRIMIRGRGRKLMDASNGATFYWLRFTLGAAKPGVFPASSFIYTLVSSEDDRAR